MQSGTSKQRSELVEEGIEGGIAAAELLFLRPFVVGWRGWRQAGRLAPPRRLVGLLWLVERTVHVLACLQAQRVQ
jgi:hypothetical protein